jgi:predicted transcriptional regulator
MNYGMKLIIKKMNNILERFSAESIEIFTNNNITGNVKMSAEDIESILIREGYEILDVVKNFFELCGHF